MSVTKIQAAKIKAIHSCPKCGEDLTRIGKYKIDKMVDLIVPVGRFKCYRCLRDYMRIL